MKKVKMIQITDCYMCPNCALNEKDDTEICSITKDRINNDDYVAIPDTCPLPDMEEDK